MKKPDKIMKVKISSLKFHPKNSVLFKRRTEEFIADLAKDINENGMLEAVTINSKGIILSGENRVRAAMLLQWEFVPARVKNPENEIAYLISRNTRRRHLVFTDRVLIYKDQYPFIFTGERITEKQYLKISGETGFLLPTIKKDIVRIRKGDFKEITIENLKEKWMEKNIKGLKLNLIDNGNNFILRIESRKLNLEFGPGQFKEVVKESYRAAESDYFSRNKVEQGTRNDLIREHRISIKMTQFQIGQKIGYSQSYIAELESGRWEVSQKLYEQILNIGSK